MPARGREESMTTARRRIHLGLGLLASALAMGAASARAETTQCTPITSLPGVITAPGVYCLTGDLATRMTSGNAIEIQADNVVLDLNGHRLNGGGAGAGTTAIGIYAYQRRNVTIRNGTVYGFLKGIYVTEEGTPIVATGLLIEDMRMDRNTYIGIQVTHRAAVIRHNQVLLTGGTTVEPGAFGIGVRGSENRVLDNDIVTLTKQGLPGTTWGIYVTSDEDDYLPPTLVIANRITNADRGITFADAVISGPSKYRDNLTRGVLVPYTGGIDAGNNH
jgi:hypothetical protein